MFQVRWYVCAPHRSALNAQGVPFGVRHAREVGRSVTACGLLARNWPMFWEMPFAPEVPGRCAECADAVVRELRLAAQRWGETSLA